MAGKRYPTRAGTKRLSSWFGFAPTETTLTSGAAIIYSLNAVALALRPFTIVRSHFALQIRSDQAAAIEQQAGAFGICVVSDQATAVGVTAVPTPSSESASDLWFIHQYFNADASDLTDRTKPATRIFVDSKAMRKVDIGQDVIVLVENAVSIGSGFIVNVSGRMLVKVN